MFIWAAVLLAYAVSTGAAMESGKPGQSASSRLPLDMALNSFDDMYEGCHDEMLKVAKDVLLNERNKDSLFREVWEKAEELYVKRRLKPKLGREQVIAIYAYTFISGDLYKPFNEAVRTQGHEYKMFKFKALHFYLTDVIQKLCKRRLEELQEGGDECLTVYRRVDRYFQRVVNEEVRFGSFTSSSLGRYPDPKNFGDKSCFKIVTCKGADISMHSRYENEAEVLIPPYEVFKVSGVKHRSKDSGLPCEEVYELISTKQAFSKFNCSFFKK